MYRTTLAQASQREREPGARAPAIADAATVMRRAYAWVLEEGAPEGGVDEPRGTAPARARESGAPGRIRKERMREGDRVARAHPQPAPARHVVEGPRDDSQAHGVELLQKRGDIPRQRAVDERLEQNRLGAVLTLVHPDQLAQDRVGVLRAWPPALDATD